MPPKAALRAAWFDRLVDALALVAGVLLCVLTLIICLDVFARNTRLFATPWSFDFSEYLLYAITFLGAPWVLRDGGHIAIDLLTDQLRPASRRLATKLMHLVGAVVCATLFVYACRVWVRSYSERTLVHETFVFPEWILLSLAPPIFLILFFVFLRALRRPRGDGAHTIGDGL